MESKHGDGSGSSLNSKLHIALLLDSQLQHGLTPSRPNRLFASDSQNDTQHCCESIWVRISCFVLCPILLLDSKRHHRSLQSTVLINKAFVQLMWYWILVLRAHCRMEDLCSDVFHWTNDNTVIFMPRYMHVSLAHWGLILPIAASFKSCVVMSSCETLCYGAVSLCFMDQYWSSELTQWKAIFINNE